MVPVSHCHYVTLSHTPSVSLTLSLSASLCLSLSLPVSLCHSMSLSHSLSLFLLRCEYRHSQRSLPRCAVECMPLRHIWRCTRRCSLPHILARTGKCSQYFDTCQLTLLVKPVVPRMFTQLRSLRQQLETVCRSVPAADEDSARYIAHMCVCLFFRAANA